MKTTTVLLIAGLLLLCFSHVSLAQERVDAGLNDLDLYQEDDFFLGCNQTCTNNNDCSNSTCSRCNNGVCVAGLPCASKCSVATDCDQAVNASCPTCRIGRCSSDGNCGSYCVGAADCYGPYCHSCVSNVCVSGCGAPCQKDPDCEQGINCGHCINGYCQAGGCGSFCGSSSDCTIGVCTTCSDNICTSACNSSCNTNSDCYEGFTGCGLCTNGICVQGDVCGTSCANSNECSGVCSTCTNGICVKAAPCGAACAVNSDCLDVPNGCPVCANSVCSKQPPQ
eukprot:TRINITY_DN6075_c0_g1_i1.p1 TRINITY_DN6075_c0_g1~~TRINITY_DN6075_c0_g1_i1.p1  ORF type:complete len:294 (-),score=33.59 TRINITY_DN6075_c0_g1_i1:27-869(-)